MARQLISCSIEGPNGDWEGGDRNDDEQQTLRESCQARWALPRRFVSHMWPFCFAHRAAQDIAILSDGKTESDQQDQAVGLAQKGIDRGRVG